MRKRAGRHRRGTKARSAARRRPRTWARRSRSCSRRTLRISPGFASTCRAAPRCTEEFQGWSRGPAMAAPHRIDVHHHIVSPGFVPELKSLLQPPTLAWTPERSIEDMDRAGVATAITSTTTPGVWIVDLEQVRRLSPNSNDYAPRL